MKVKWSSLGLLLPSRKPRKWLKIWWQMAAHDFAMVHFLFSRECWSVWNCLYYSFILIIVFWPWVKKNIAVASTAASLVSLINNNNNINVWFCYLPVHGYTTELQFLNEKESNAVYWSDFQVLAEEETMKEGVMEEQRTGLSGLLQNYRLQMLLLLVYQ